MRDLKLSIIIEISTLDTRKKQKFRGLRYLGHCGKSGFYFNNQKLIISGTSWQLFFRRNFLSSFLTIYYNVENALKSLKTVENQVTLYARSLYLKKLF